MQSIPATSKHVTWANLVLIAAMLVMMLTPSAQVNAAPKPQEENPSPSMFLVLPAPDQESYLDLPTATSPHKAKEMARNLILRQAEPLLNELNELKSRGLIESYTLQPENFGIAVSGVTGDAVQAIKRNDSIAYSTSSSQDVPACAVESAKSLTQRLTIDHKRIEESAREQSQLTMLYENWIQVYMEPFSGYSQVYGFMPADKSVRFEILRNGLLLYSETKVSDYDGWFSFYPNWVSCPQSGYNFSIYPGDTVRVISGSVVKSMKVAEMVGYANPATDTITGTSLPGQQIDVIYGIPKQDGCGRNVYFETATTADDGSFTHTVSKDITAQGFVELHLVDAGGSTLAVPATIHRISMDPAPTSGVLINLPPSVPYTGYHKRDGTTVEEITGTTAIDGWDYFNVSDSLQHGDVVEVTGGGVSLSMTVASIQPTVNVNTNVISGTTGPNLRIQVEASTDLLYSLQPGSCADYSWFCGMTSSNASGSFSANTNIDLQPGNSYYITTFDAQGNSTSYRYYISAIGFDTNSDMVSVAWGPSPNPISVTHKTSTGDVRETFSVIADPYWRDFNAYLSNPANPGDVIEVSTSDGQKRTLTVQNLPVRLKAGTGTVTGTSPFAGLFAAEVRDFNPTTGTYQYSCQELSASGKFTLTYSGKTWGGQDIVEYSLRDPKGNYLLGQAYAFMFYVWKGYGDISGRTETPGVKVTIKHTQAGVTQTIETTSSDSGYYYSGTNRPVEEGDTVEVSAADGSKSSMVVPKLTLVKDPARNRIYGQAPASSYLRASLYRNYAENYLASNTVYTKSDRAGNYIVNMAGLAWQQNCSAVDVGDSCFYSVVRHYTAGGHGVYLQGDYPTAIGPDTYEDDDIWANATPYTGGQVHTFESSVDVDWVSYTVTPEMLQERGFAVLTLSVTRMGWDMVIEGELHKVVNGNLSLVTDGMRFMDSNQKINLVLTEPGDYVLALYPRQGTYSAGLCDSSYMLGILTGSVFVPTIGR